MLGKKDSAIVSVHPPSAKSANEDKPRFPIPLPVGVWSVVCDEGRGFSRCFGFRYIDAKQKEVMSKKFDFYDFSNHATWLVANDEHLQQVFAYLYQEFGEDPDLLYQKLDDFAQKFFADIRWHEVVSAVKDIPLEL